MFFIPPSQITDWLGDAALEAQYMCTYANSPSVSLFSNLRFGFLSSTYKSTDRPPSVPSVYPISLRGVFSPLQDGGM